jgi:hypothetical protein
VELDHPAGGKSACLGESAATSLLGSELKQESGLPVKADCG